jgi:phosphatidylserine/phosphatidylglycerophosphate/cardiolipin synthase-like enzyme
VKRLLDVSTTALQDMRDTVARASWPLQMCKGAEAAAICDALRSLTTAAQAIAMLDLLLQERRARQRDIDATELVWSGPEEGPSETRETAVVLRELFLGAKRDVLVATYAIHEGAWVFADLARRHDAGEITVRMLLHVEPEPDPLAARERCVASFREKWPGKTIPQLWFDPRTARLATKKTSMHAKFVVVDDDLAFVTSANFTEAAQERNIEAGVLVRSAPFARRLREHFDRQIAHELFERLST